MEERVQGKLTEGPILRVLLKLALPIMASSFLSTAYSITDMAWIGMLGSKAVAGVGASSMYSWLSNGLSMLARMGGQVHVAQAIGLGDRERAKRFASGAIQLVIILGVIFGSVCLLFTEQLVGFFGLTDPVTLKYAYAYMKIACGLVIFAYIGNVLTGLFTAQGDSATPLKANAIGLITNMVLDPLLILGVGPFPRLEVIGAAAATVTAQFIVVTVLVVSIIRTKTGENILKEISLILRPSKEDMKELIRIGGPTAIQNMVYCGISMVLTRIATTFGEGAIASQRVGGQIESISWNTADGFAVALNAFVGQNFGAGKKERVQKGYRIAITTIFAWGLAVGIIFYFFAEPISTLFFHEPEIVLVSAGYLMIMGFSQPLLCVESVAIGGISGLGNTKICSIFSIILTGMRIPLSLLLAKTSLGVEGVWWAITISSIIKGIVFHLIFKNQCKKAFIGRQE